MTNKPLCVDLDGTFLQVDTIHQACWLACKRKPWLLLLFAVWIIFGKVFFKRQLFKRVALNPAKLPVNPAVLQLIQQAKSEGRTIILITGTDDRIAQQIAAYHHGLFDEVIATTRNSGNMIADTKRHLLNKRYGVRGYDYVGNSKADLKVWPDTDVAYNVNPKLQEQLKGHEHVVLL